MNEKIRCLSRPCALVIFLFCALTITQFWPAITGHANISKVHQLAEWDSIFDAQRSGQSMLMDPSLVYLMVPSYLLKATIWHSGHLPLWNQYSGLGCPLLADPQSLTFSPLHIPLILNPSLTAYNQVLVLEILVLGISTFALARSLNLGLAASTFAMTAIAFCPYERWYLELLGNGYCFIPLVFCLLLRLRQNSTPAKIWFAALGCAIMVVSAHPELSFFSIGLASLALLLSASANKTLAKTAIALTATGFLTFMLAAPMLLPFLEYLSNSDSYKFGSGAPAVVRWQTLIFDLLQPGFGAASPTLGPSAFLLIPLAFTAAKKHRPLVYILTGIVLFCIMVTGKLFPLNLLLAKPPLTYLVVNYAFPTALLLTALLAAYGLQAALDSVDSSNSPDNVKDSPTSKIALCPWAVAVSVVLAMAVVGFPLISKALQLSLISANFDMCLPDFAFNRNDVLRYSIFALVAAIAVLAVKIKPVRKTAIFLTAAVFIGQSAEVITANKSLAKRPAFQYQEPTVIPTLQSETNNGRERFIATGNHLLRPNTNVVFGVSDLRTHNPLFPKRYIAFVKACGAKLDEFNQTFDSPLSPLLSLASVKAVLSQTPVMSMADAAISNQKGQPLSVESGKTTGADYSLVFESKARNAIYRNNNALPRAFIVHRTLTARDGDTALAAIQDSGFNPRQVVVVENPPQPGPAPVADLDADLGSDLVSGQTQTKEDKVQIVSADGDKIVIETESSLAGVLVLNDMYYPGWQCAIDQQSEVIRRANFAMRAVHLTAGKHRVVFEYRPLSLTIGFLLFLTALLEGILLPLKSRMKARESGLKVVDVTGKDSGQSGDIDHGETKAGT